jgi:hypothetical protein
MLRERTKTMGFDRYAVEKILRDEGKRNPVSEDHLSQLRAIQGLTQWVDDRYMGFKYIGPISREDMESCGCEVPASIIDEMWGIVWVVEGIVVKADPYFLDSNKHPYSLCYCERDTTSPFGWGIPRLMRNEQRAANAAWRMMIDNAGLSTGPQSVMDVKNIKPLDGDPRMSPRKQWVKNPDMQNVPVKNLLDFFTVESHQAELMNIFDLALRLGDDVTSTPLITQGDQAAHITKTAQGMTLLWNAANVVLKRAVKFYDDYMLTIIDRFYEWEMQFNSRPEIKGDFKVIPRGSSVLMEREQQSQSMMQLMQFKGTAWDAYFDWYIIAEAIGKSMRVEDVVPPRDKVEERELQQQQAAQQAAQAGVAQPPPPPTPAIDPFAERKTALAERELLLQERMQQDKMDALVIEYATKRRMSLDAAQKELAMLRIREDGANKRFAAEVIVKHKLGSGI